MSTALITCKACGFQFSVDEDSIGDSSDPLDEAETVSCPGCLRDIDPWSEQRAKVDESAIVRGKVNVRREVFE